MNRSPISWTDYSGSDANFVLRGKKKGDCEVSPGCTNCYAYRIRTRNPDKAADETTYSTDKLHRLARWKPKDDGLDNRRGPGSRPMVFVVDMADLFHRLVPDDFIMEALEVMSAREDIDWQVLTKRPERMARLWKRVPDHVWIGVTAENQEMADLRWGHLLKVRADIHFISCEPMLERITPKLKGMRWVICGGESGANRRPFERGWARHLYRCCDKAGLPFYFKQGSHTNPSTDYLLDGEVIHNWPK